MQYPLKTDFALLSILFLTLLSGCKPSGSGGKSMPDGASAASRTVTDMRGQKVRVPAVLERVVAIDDGFTASVMAHLGEIRKIAGLGSSCIQRNFSYAFESVSGAKFAYENGMNPVSLLYPFLRELPLVAAANAALNYEMLAKLQPDAVVLRTGSCTLGCLGTEATDQAIRRMTALGIPVIVLLGPPCREQYNVTHISEEIRVLGQLFDKEAQANQLAALLENKAAAIRQIAAGTGLQDKPRVLMLGLSPKARSSGGAGNTKGTDTMESFLLEEYALAQNAYRGAGGKAAGLLLSAEQILALDPDIIVLPTSSGYHPPEELYEAPYFQQLQNLKAVKNKRVYALPWMPCNCAKRLEYPIELLIMAKAAHPDKFQHVKAHRWALEFYQELYHVDEATAVRMRSAQWLDWTAAQDF